MYQFEGAKHSKKFIDITEITKLVKNEIHNTFPGIKVGVTSERFSMGRSITVTIKSMPISRYIYNTNNPGLKESEEWYKLQKELRAIANSYNKIETDAQSDYFSYDYFATVSLDPEATQEGNIKLQAGEYAILEDRGIGRDGTYYSKLRDWKGVVFEATLTVVPGKGYDTEILKDGVFYWKGMIDLKRASHEVIEELIAKFEEV